MYPEEYIKYLMHFHGDRDYFECHEILEEYWKKVDRNNKSSVWVGLILLAVSNYHHRRSNYKGAERTLKKAITILKNSEKHLDALGLDKKVLISDLGSKLDQISSGNPYSSYNLPINDPKLVSKCRKLCTIHKIPWCKESDLKNQDIIHRHSRRNRLPVINERLTALQKKQEKRK